MIIEMILENLEQITAGVVAIAGTLGLSIPKIRKSLLSKASKSYKQYRLWRQKEIYESQQEILKIIKKLNLDEILYILMKIIFTIKTLAQESLK